MKHLLDGALQRRHIRTIALGQLLAIAMLLVATAPWAIASTDPTQVTIGAQSGIPVYGTVGTASYPVTILTTQGNGWTDIVLTGLPAGITYAPTRVQGCKTGCNVTLTLTTSTTTPAVDNLPFTMSVTGAGTASATGYLTITGFALTLTAVTATKTYDGTVAATGTPSMTGSLKPGDVATLSQVFDSKNAGSRHLVPVITFTSGSASNYSITYVQANGTIDPRPITVAATAGTKVYDKTAASAAVPHLTSGSIATGDTATFSQTYSSQDVGPSLTLTPAGSVSDGNSGNNYAVTFTTATGSITARPITVTAATNSKGYDGTTSAAALPTITSGSLASGDTATWSETYQTASVGANKTLVPSGSVNDGNGGNNYAVTFANDTTGIITAYTVTITPDSGQTKVYGTADPTSFGYTFSGLQNGDTSAVFSGNLGRTPGEDAGPYAYTIGTLSAGPNYTVQLATTPVTFEITKAGSTVTVNCPSTAAYTGAPLTPCTASATAPDGLNVDLHDSIVYGNNVAFGATATAGVTWAGDTNHTGNTGSDTFQIVANALHSIVVSPSTATIPAGGSQPYTVEGFDQYNNSLGDVTADATFDLDGTLCGGTSCGSNVAGPHTVTATIGTITGTATLTVTAGVVDHILLDPLSSSIVAGGHQDYTARAFDQFGNDLGDVTSGTTFVVDNTTPCSGATCAPTAAGLHTVKGTYGTAVGTASLTVTAGNLHHIVISPDSVTITAGGGQSYTAKGYDVGGNELGDVTNDTTFTIGAVSCPTHVCSATIAGHYTVTGTDGTMTDTATLDVVAGPAVTLALTSGITVSDYTWTAGVNHSLYVRLYDMYGNLATGYTGTVHFSSSDTRAVLPADYTFTVGDGGSRAFPLSAMLKTAGRQSIGAADTVDVALAQTMHDIVVLPAGGSSLTVSGLSGLDAGVAGSVTVTIRDKFGNPATGYRGVVHLSSSDTKAVLPADYGFTATDAGAHVFSVTLKTSGHQSIVAGDTATTWLKGSQWTDVRPGPAVSLLVKSGAYDWMGGDAHSVYVTALDAFANVATGYTGTVTFSGTDSLATLPGNYTFVGGDAGTHAFMFQAVLKTAGLQSITATDTVTASITGTASGIVVQPNGANSMTISALPNPFTAGSTSTITVKLFDKYGNIASRYTGTIHFSSSDTAAVLPGDYTFTAGDAGVKTFNVTLNTAGTQYVLAGDTSTLAWVKAKVSTTVR